MLRSVPQCASQKCLHSANRRIRVLLHSFFQGWNKLNMSYRVSKYFSCVKFLLTALKIHFSFAPSIWFCFLICIFLEMKEEENWRIKYLKFFNSKSYRFPIGGAGYFQWAEFFCQMLVLCIIMIFIALKRHTIRRNGMSVMFFWCNNLWWSWSMFT